MLYRSNEMLLIVSEQAAANDWTMIIFLMVWFYECWILILPTRLFHKQCKKQGRTCLILVQYHFAHTMSCLALSLLVFQLLLSLPS